MNQEGISVKEQRTHFIIIAIVCIFAFFVNNQVIPADLMEARNLATAQEMVRSGDYLIPRMNGELRLEKPPLPTWIAAGIENIIPGNLVVQRYAAGLSASLMIVFLYLLVSFITRNRKVGLMASLILATCFNIILMGRTATWDIYCHSFMVGAIYFFVLAFNKEGAQWKNFIVAGTFMGLSFLSKGPVSLYALFLSFLISYIIVYRPKLKGKVFPLVSMIVVFLIISFWWSSFILLFHQDMALNVAEKESSSWLNHNVRPWYYYWQFPAEAGIWALFLVSAIVSFFVFKKQELRREYKFSILWLLISLILLSIIPEKKTRYLLPILIPASIVVSLYIYQYLKGFTRKSERILFQVNATIIAVILIAIPVVLYIMFYKEGLLSLPILLIAAICSWAISIFIFRALFRNGVNVSYAFGAIIATMILVEAICLIPIGHMFINTERKSISELRNNKEVQSLPFYYNQEEFLRIEIVYESNQILKPMDLLEDKQIYDNLPFVLVSGAPIDSIFINKDVIVEKIGVYDNNWRKVGHKRYNKDLTREVAIIKKKQTETIYE
ncbi:MAG: glycosyltransferase family 39 protein [Dysgonomonas sp.]|nr:glycosyltransferase family 39 protein [Dysgonomonas sp.]